MRFHVCDSTERTRVAMGMVGRGASREAWQWLVAKSVSSRMWYVFPRSGGQSEISRMGSCGRRGHKKKGEGGEGEGKGEGVASTAYPIVTPSQTPALFSWNFPPPHNRVGIFTQNTIQ